MPRTHGDGFVHVSKIDSLVWQEMVLPEVNYGGEATRIVELIGENVASLIPDGATLQMGIGHIPDQVLRNLYDHKDLGLHTEMFSDGVIGLIEAGVINNRRKKLNPGKSVTSFINGTRRIFDFVDDNPEIRVMDIAYVNDTAIIRQNPRVAAINSAIEIDLTGQICADSMGFYQYSGIGGQMDFIHGASFVGGRSTHYSDAFRDFHRPFAYRAVFEGRRGCRHHPGPLLHWVVTEYGRVDLFGKNLKQRAQALVSIAHPTHREWLGEGLLCALCPSGVRRCTAP